MIEIIVGLVVGGAVGGAVAAIAANRKAEEKAASVKAESEAEIARLKDSIHELETVGQERFKQAAIDHWKKQALEEEDKAHQAKHSANESAAKAILLSVMERNSATWTAESATASVEIASEEVKGKLIGREGRNIRTFQQVTGVDLIIDDSPKVVTLSCLDPERRMKAEITLKSLLLDGRIHPGRIEEIHAETTQNFERNFLDLGSEAAERAEVKIAQPEILQAMGRLRFRSSQGQNVLEHSVEVANLAAGIASELGLDANSARRAGFLHDIGKALDPEWGAAHALAGRDFLKSFRENSSVVQAVAAHHHDVPPTTSLDFLVITADRISGSRPGARFASADKVLARIKKVEEIAKTLNGIAEAHAYDAGREIRVFVKPDAVNDEGLARIAKQITRMLSDGNEYPGGITVTVIRESRAVESTA